MLIAMPFGSNNRVTVQSENIHEVIIRGERDSFMKGADLFEQVLEEDNKTFLTASGLSHNDHPISCIERALDTWLECRQVM